MYTQKIQEPAPENTNHPRSHSRAIMALDYSRLRLENKFLHGKQIRPNFLRSTRLLYKILPTNFGVCKPTFYILFILTSHLRWNSTMRHCIHHTDLGQNAVFHNFSRQIEPSQYSGTINPGLFNSETVQKISKITYTASRFSFLTSAKLAVRAVSSVWMNINRVTLQHNKEFIMFILLVNGFITFDKRGILSPPASDVHEWLKTSGTAIKFAKEPGVCLFQRWTQNKKIAQSFLSTAKFITKYPSERFFLSTVRKYI